MKQQLFFLRVLIIALDRSNAYLAISCWMCNGLKPLASFGINCSRYMVCVYIRSIFDQKRRLHRFIILFLVWVLSITPSSPFVLNCPVPRRLSNRWRSGNSNRKWKRCSRWERRGWTLSSLISLGVFFKMWLPFRDQLISFLVGVMVDLGLGKTRKLLFSV